MGSTSGYSGYRSVGLVAGKGVFTCLASSTCRHLLAVLYDHAPNSVTRQHLATHLSSSRHDDQGDEDIPRSTERAQLALHHTYVPKLKELELIDVDPESGAISLRDHPVFEDERIVEAIRGEWNEDEDSIDTLFAGIAHPRRRTILDILRHQYGPIHTEALASEIRARENVMAESAVPAEDLQQILITLIHNHLPKLAEAKLVAYDRNEHMVSYKGHSKLEVP